MDLASLLFRWLNPTGSGHRPDWMRRKLSPSGIASILNYCAPRRGPPIYRVTTAMLIKRVEVRCCDQTAESRVHLPPRLATSPRTKLSRNVVAAPRLRNTATPQLSMEANSAVMSFMTSRQVRQLRRIVAERYPRDRSWNGQSADSEVLGPPPKLESRASTG